ncbi:MAG: tRNA preQ1(34) S-adenosylmethionine ribosyltransferase-isomerase QueA [Planctomycetota bacterium]|jgi:S-adenosylmethionine:tRNA ribosyltransferase-isomerase
MRVEKLNYTLPAELIAQAPCEVRSESRLLVLGRADGAFEDSRFDRIEEYLKAGDCLVLNNTRVLQARFFARRKSGGKLEGLFLTERAAGVWEVMLKGAGKLKTREVIELKDKGKNDFCRAVLLEKLGEGRCFIRLDKETGAETILEAIGYPPLPPYIRRGDDAAQAAVDRRRYQTVYAERTGAVAAPTAGLHFTDELLRKLQGKGVKLAYITLHAGEGTFRPMKVENLEEHKIHEERFSIDEENAGIINKTKEDGRRIIAVGTTSVRALETAATNPPEVSSLSRIETARPGALTGRQERIEAKSGLTQLFIRPGYKFRITDAMVTNFHLPKSTLLALVASFAGLENTLAAYNHAIEKRYRFYSYGDAMLII